MLRKILKEYAKEQRYDLGREELEEEVSKIEADSDYAREIILGIFDDSINFDNQSEILDTLKKIKYLVKNYVD